MTPDQKNNNEFFQWVKSGKAEKDIKSIIELYDQAIAIQDYKKDNYLLTPPK